MENQLIIVGVNIGGLATLGFIAVRFVLKQVWNLVIVQQSIITNHLAHSTTIMTEVRDAVRELTSAVRDTRQVITSTALLPPPQK